MSASSTMVSQALFQSLIEAPRLIGDLPEAAAFDPRLLSVPAAPGALNLRQKLGHLYEDALAVMLSATPQFDVLGRSMQLGRAAGQTLGELDFLMRNRGTGQVVHLELAVKFYLAVESKDGTQLPGPNASDNYFRKLDRMRSHQLVLTQRNRDLLPEAFRDQDIVVQQLVHGCLFEHVNAARPLDVEFLNPHGRRGKWLRAAECADHFGQNAGLQIIPKPLWPVPLERLKGIELERWPLADDIDRCVMVRAEANPTPYFIAPNRYPGMS